MRSPMAGFALRSRKMPRKALCSAWSRGGGGGGPPRKATGNSLFDDAGATAANLLQSLSASTTSRSWRRVPDLLPMPLIVDLVPTSH